MAQGKFEKAEGWMKKAMETEPDSVFVLAKAGHCYKEQQKYSQAEELLRKAIEIDPTYRDSYTELASCYREQGRLKELSELCEKMRKQNLKSGCLYGF